MSEENDLIEHLNCNRNRNYNGNCILTAEDAEELRGLRNSAIASMFAARFCLGSSLFLCVLCVQLAFDLAGDLVVIALRSHGS